MVDIRPVHYSLHLEPNLETFVFKGNASIDFETDTPVRDVELHSLEISYQKISVDFGEGEQEVDAYTLDEEKQTLNIRLPENSVKQFTLKFEYTGEHNDKLAGFYRSKFIIDGQEEYVVVTQFQANDARRAFPCVDIPGYKATYDIELLVDTSHVAISNMPVKEENNVSGKKLVVFERTPKMSSYLVFFAVGRFDSIEKEHAGRKYRVLASPGKPQKHGNLALEFGIKVVEFCEDYFDFPYPLPKLDQIATPDFAAGAMENWGAILYRENALLYYDGITSETQKNGILGVIAHEIAHQWFGNLVSPLTWKYIWLNESFATFFSNVVVDHYYPERRVFEFFVQSTNLSRRSRSTMGVMDWDSMVQTSPIEIDGEGEISFTAKTVPILYTKGGSILRQIRAYLGDEVFRDGLRAYFKKHAYGATVSNYLWESLAEISGKPVGKIMQSFVLQKGLPLVTVNRKGTTLNLTQRRFTYLPHDSNSVWNIPLTIKVFNGDEEKIIPVLFDKNEMNVDIGKHDAFKLNVALTGYYRVQYSPEVLDELKELIKKKRLPPLDRVNIEDDLFALLKAGNIDLDDYLSFVECYNDDDSHMLMLNVTVHLLDLYLALNDGEKKVRVKERGKLFTDHILKRISLNPPSEEPLGISIIRGTIIKAAVKFGSSTAKKYALEQFERLRNGEKVSADLRSTFLTIGASETNDFDWFRERFDNPESESEFINTIVAMTAFTDPETLEKVKEMVFTDVPSRNRGMAIAGLCDNSVCRDDMWLWYIANLDSFEALNNFMFQGAIVSVVSNSEKSLDDMKKFFDDYVKKNPRISDAVDVGLEQVEIKLRFKSLLNE